MPVLINSENQLAEDLPQDQAELALNQGTHQLPLNDPQGNPVVAPLNKAQQLVSQGYTQPDPEQLGSLLKYSKYSSPEQEIKAGLEGAASGATFGLSTGIERALGVNPEDINARAETNPNIHMAGEAAGLIGSSLTGVGEGAALARVGEAVGAKLAGETVLAKVGSAAAKNAVETALVASGDEVSKMFAGNPEQSAQTALVNIGLNGLLGAGIGGAFGTASPLWKAANETKVGQFLNVIKNKANGLNKETLPTADIQSALETTGIDLPNEMKAALSENPESRAMFQELQESLSRPGKEAQQSLQAFKEKANDIALSSLGKTPEQVESLYNLSENKIGSGIQDSLKNEIQTRTSALSEKFENVKNQFSKEEFPSDDITNLSNKLGEINQQYAVSPSSPEFKKINTIIEELKNVKTLEQFRNFQSTHLGNIAKEEMWGLNREVKAAFRDAEENIVEQKLGLKSPELLEEHKAARAGYRSEMDTLDDLNNRLHVGSFSTPGQFLYKLKEMTPEKLLNRMTKINDAGFLNLLQEKFPQTTQSIKDSFLNQALEKAAAKAPEGQAINAKTLSNIINQWSPELRQFALPAGAEQKINALATLLDKIPDRVNPSGTGKIVNDGWSKISGGAVGLASLLTGHSPVASFITGALTKYLGTHIPDAVKLATLKFLGSDLPVNSAGFRAMAELVSHSMEGQRMIESGIKSIFKSGAQVLPQKFDVTDKDRNKLKKRLDQLNQKPEDALDTGGDSHYYLPDEGGAFGAVTARAMQYLNTLKPNTTPAGLLDKEREPNVVETAKYDRALDIAQQPLTVLKHINQSTLLPEDVVTLKTIYPAIYDSLSQKMVNQIIDLKNKKNDIPYSKKMSLSLFLAQPLDSTLTPQAIQSVQPQPPQANSPGPAPQRKGPGPHSMKALAKYSQPYQTPGQARLADRQKS